MEASELEKLQKAADYYAFKKSLKSIPTANIIFGILNIIFGLVGIAGGFILYYLMIIIGVLLVFVGIWPLVARKPLVFLLSGIFLCLVGIADVLLFISLMAFTRGEGVLNIVYPFLGSFSFGFGLTAFPHYRRFSSKVLDKPSNEMLQKVEDIIRPIMKANVNKETDVLQFMADKSWKVKLGKSTCIMTSKSGDDIIFAKPQDFEIKITDSRWKRVKNLRIALFSVKGKSFKGGMDDVSIQRYESWKKSA